MERYMSSFSIYEILRIILPGFYLLLFITDLLNNSEDMGTNLTEIMGAILFSILAFLAGATIYSVDFCRIYKPLTKKLPTRLLKNDLEDEEFSQFFEKVYGKISRERELENTYYEFYDELELKDKYKTELQSGLYHLFSNFTLTILLCFVIYYFLTIYCEIKCFSSFHEINLIVLAVSVVGTATIYNFRLSHSWERHYKNFRKMIIEKGKKSKFEISL